MKSMAFDIRNLPFAGTVTRWHSVNCHRYPSVAEHSCLVALYAREIASRVYPSLSAEDQVLLYELALMHDLSEVVTGDMPSPIKRQLKTVFPPGESPPWHPKYQIASYRNKYEGVQILPDVRATQRRERTG